ncbi:MAG TPA: hypothetical protein PLC98_25650 [Anaerolineales bacterium]|nr:hypothetical protein [Anaerolineales bacterium]
MKHPIERRTISPRQLATNAHRLNTNIAAITKPILTSNNLVDLHISRL